MTYINGGYYCSCGSWVPNGYFHRCPNRYGPYNLPYTPPMTVAPVPPKVIPGVTDERVREIIRGELAKLERKDDKNSYLKKLIDMTLERVEVAANNPALGAPHVGVVSYGNWQIRFEYRKEDS